MGVLTHGGTLPDSSQKTDFYGLIDNGSVSSIVDADISSGAAIQDSKLNTISTAGKVNVSALTGQIANTNLAQLTEAALVSGAALTLLPNVPSGAGLLPVANIGGIIGNSVSKTNSQIYQALTDGIVVATGFASGGANISAVSDATSSPSIVVAANDTAATSCSVCFPVKKNNYYQVNITGQTTYSIFFFPLGS